MDRNTFGLLRKHELTHTQLHRRQPKNFFISFLQKKDQAKENKIVTFTVLPGQALYMQISPSYRAPEDLMPESRELPNQ